MAVLEIVARDADGELIGEPAVWDAGRRRAPARAGAGRARLGARRASRRSARATASWRASRASKTRTCPATATRREPIKRLPKEKRRQLGIFRTRAKGGGVIDPVDRKELKEWPIAPGDEGDAKDGDLVRFDLARSGRFGVPQARVVETLGNPQDQRKISLIAVHAHGIPDEFPARRAGRGRKARAARSSRAAPTCARSICSPSIPSTRATTTMPCTPRPTPIPATAGGWIVHVAIADVAHYVRPGTRLDREAQMRGNSVYFPDRVVPMLPEKISNDLCSLQRGRGAALPRRAHGLRPARQQEAATPSCAP